MLKKLFSILVLSQFLLPVAFILARPQYTLLTGNNCINCHISANGAGQRSVLGSYARNSVTLIKDSSLVDFFDNFNKLNFFGDKKFLWGFDYRSQSAAMGDPSDSKRKFFIMQISPYLSYLPAKWLTISGMYNLLYLPDDISGTSKALKYIGQKSWSAYAIIQPGLQYPGLKIGYFSPSVGTKYDDHTVFIRQQWTSYPVTILPPDNNELGAELSYNHKNWVQLTAGAYGAKTMSQIMVNDQSGSMVPLVEPNSQSYLGKIVFSPRLFENHLNTYIGSSYFFNHDFNILSAFAGLGLTDNLTLLGEMARVEKKSVRSSDNFMIEACYQALEGLILSVRYETASTDDYSVRDAINQEFTNFKTQSYVFGANIFPIPNVEIRPEYRILDRKDYRSYAAQWAVQFHLYY